MLEARPNTNCRRSIRPVAYLDSLHKQALEALNQGLPDRAITFFNKVIAIDSSQSEAFVGRGRALILQGELEKALVDFARVLRENESHADALAYRARVMYQLKKLDDARSDMEKALAIDSSNAAALLTRAQLQSDSAKACVDLSAAIESDSENPELYFLRALLHEKNDEPALAIADLRKVIDLRPAGFRDARHKLKLLLANTESAAPKIGLVKDPDPAPARKRANKRPSSYLYDVNDLWSRMEKWLEKKLPASLKSLNGGIGKSDFDAFEKELGIALPADFKLFYSIHNGQQEDENLGIFFGLRPLPLSEIISHWQECKELSAKSDKESGILSGFKSFPPNSVRRQFLNEHWVPFTHDYSGNHIGVDLDPGPKGTFGQIINFGRDSDVKFVLARSFGEFFQRLVSELERGNFIIDDDCDFTLRERPPIQYFEHLFFLTGSGAWNPQD